jgi:hypothetical protein
LRRVIELVPTAPTFVGVLLAEQFPHPRAPLNSHIHYLRHAIMMLEYAPNFEKQLLSLIVDRMLQIDVGFNVAIESNQSYSTSLALVPTGTHSKRRY